jgi:hypothetical protein
MKTITIKITARTSDDLTSTIKLMEVYAVTGEPIKHSDTRQDGSASYDYKAVGQFDEKGSYEKDVEERARVIAAGITYDCKAPIEAIPVQEGKHKKFAKLLSEIDKDRRMKQLDTLLGDTDENVRINN